MSGYLIEGGRPLSGSLAVQGAKNSALPILAATVLAREPCTIRHCPDLSDVQTTLEILRLLGCRTVRQGDTVEVDPTGLSGTLIPEQLMGRLRSSVIFMGALLARTGQARLAYPGGCELGPRPIDLHLTGLRALGAEIREEGGLLTCCAGSGMEGRNICLPTPSVGATENLMLAACGCRGTTVLTGAAREPEIVDLQRFLCSMGAHVSGGGSSVVVIEGGVPLHGGDCRVMGDRIAAATYLCAAGAAGGEVDLTGVEPEHLPVLLTCLEEAGCAIRTEAARIILRSDRPLKGISPVRTAPFPGFPTDAQAILMAALAGGTGTTMFVETIFDSRYRHVDELRRMGARIQTCGQVAVVTGAGELRGAAVSSPDLRGGAALVVAGLAARGTTAVRGLHHIRRGYEQMADTLTRLGAAIRPLPDPNEP